jgi:hypothetical protein
MSQVEMRVLGKHQIEVGCVACGSTLRIYASRQGAFCQWRENQHSVVYGSLPNPNFMSSGCRGAIPRSIKLLFKGNWDGEMADRANEMSASVSESREEDADMDMMFSNRGDPFVGSYSQQGEFATDGNYLVFVE